MTKELRVSSANSKKPEFCSRHPKTLIYYSPEEGPFCRSCYQEELNSLIQGYFCANCGNKGDHTYEDGDEGYHEFSCRKCISTTRVYFSVDYDPMEGYEPCDGCKNTPAGSPRVLCQGGGCRG